MNKNSLKQMIVAEMIYADARELLAESHKKRSLFEMMDDDYLAELDDRKFVHSMKMMLEEGFGDADQANIYNPNSGGNRKPAPVAEPIAAPDNDVVVDAEDAKAGNIKLSDDQKLKLKDTFGEEIIDLVLSVAGFLGGIAGVAFAGPTGGISLVIGAVPDVVNGIRKINRGEYFDGLIDFICAIPVVGEYAVTFKGVKNLENLLSLSKFIKDNKSVIKFIKMIIDRFVVDTDKKEATHAVLDDLVDDDENKVRDLVSGGDSVGEGEGEGEGGEGGEGGDGGDGGDGGGVEGGDGTDTGSGDGSGDSDGEGEGDSEGNIITIDGTKYYDGLKYLNKISDEMPAVATESRLSLVDAFYA